MGGAFGTHSAYITDDTFAALGFGGTYSIDYQISVDDGWLIAIDSGSISAEGTDDGISWGLWGIDTSYSENDLAMGAWVAGQNIVSDISTMNMSGIVSYSGQAMGMLTDNVNNLSTFIDPTISTMNLSFDFGTGDITAALNANSGEYIQSITGNSQDLTAAGSSIYTMYVDDQNSYGNIQGSFYNNGDTTAGSFIFSNPGSTAAGVYKAAQQATAP